MIRKGESNTKIDSLVNELDEHFISQLKQSTQKINFVRKGNKQGEELQKMYEESKVKT